MSTAAISEEQPEVASVGESWQTIRELVLKPMGSLKITCFLLAVSMLLVLVGSLAQARRDVWMVVTEYFRTWIAWVQVKDLFPPTMFPSMIDYDWNELGIWKSFPYPGGWLIGTAMAMNLFAAHIYRMRLSVTGMRLKMGVVALVGAVSVTTLIIMSGNASGVQSEPLLGYNGVWNLIMGSLTAVSVGGLALAFGPFAAKGNARWMWCGGAVLSGMVLAHFLIGGNEARLTNESMRILWQLVLGSIAASAMLIACSLLFRKRAGIVVLHLGIVMLMYSELQVAMFGRENQMTLSEGETATYLRDIRERELAIVERDGEKENVYVVPEHELRSAADSKSVVGKSVLPFPIRVRDFYINSELSGLEPGSENIATAGLGAFATAVKQDPRTGMDELPDISSVYIDILKPDESVASTHLVSQEASELRGEFAERITVEGKTYDLFLRSMRTYRPWTVKLKDVSRTNYIGTATPKDFRSTFVITDETGKEHEFTTWMNNPVRFGGETFYQQGYQEIPGTGKFTTLQVVRNTGWMLPYIGCMVVAFGMFAQFGQTLGRFLNRVATIDKTESKESSRLLMVGVPVLIIGCMAGWILGKAVPRSAPDGVMDLRQFAQVPVAAGGRIQPFETFAQNSLLSLLGKATFEGEMEPDELDSNRDEILTKIRRAWPEEDWKSLETFNGDYVQWLDRIVEISESDPYDAETWLREHMTKKRPAVWWMLDVITRPNVAERHRVYRIVDDQLLALMSLKKRPGLAYSAAEFKDRIPDLREIYSAAHKLLMDEQAARLTPLQRRVHSLLDDHSRVLGFAEVFNPRPDENSLSFETVAEAWRLMKLLESRPATLIVPTGSDKEETAWESGVAADALVRTQQVFERLQINDAASAVPKLLASITSEAPSPRERVSETLPLMIRMLEETEKQEDPSLAGETLALQIRKRAGEAKDSDRIRSEPYLQAIMALIADSSPEQTAEEILAALSDDEIKELIGDRRPSTGAVSVLETLDQLKDHRNDGIKTRLNQMISHGMSAADAIDKETVQLIVDDLKKSSSHLLFVPNQSDSVLAKANGHVQSIFAAWKSGDVSGFNKHANEYHTWLEAEKLPFLSENASLFFGAITVNNVAFESYVNGFAPEYYTIFLYLTALILTFLSWITLRKPMWRSAMGVTVVALIVHSFYLYARMKISGRPPVTNLYSSAVFIGWGVVLGSLVVERFSKLGLMNVIGCSSGAATLCMAYFLGVDEGDTLSVMQAVLDTQFWLATHVVCVTIGYAATFLAGLLSVGYCIYYLVLRQPATKGSTTELLGKVIYGTICFALIFSFVGTVLGGLWADDSWGRFWGWDPKENGALLIVIWNALILHARWDKMVRDYGTAVLAIGGNIVTAWSWFGVNELGAGLHKYGFTEGRLMYLAMFVVANAIFMLLATATYNILSRRTRPE